MNASSSACLKREPGEGVSLAEQYPAMAEDVRAAEIELPNGVDAVIQTMLDRTSRIYMNDGKMDGVSAFPLPKCLSTAANNEMTAFVKSAGLERYLTDTMDC